MNHIKLGKLIRKVDGNKNKQLKDLPLLGINIDKEFMPSVANTIGTDMSNYQIVKMKQFACNPMHLGRDERMPTALLLNQDEILVSPAYFVFEVIDKNVILPEYLMLYFKQPETDRLLWFKTDSSVRGGLGWNELCDIEIPVPDLQVQKDIIRQYNQISDAIKIKEKLNNNLEQQAICLFKNIFNDDVDCNVCRADEYFDITIGKTPSRNDEECFTTNPNDVPWISIADMGKCSVYIDKTSEYLTQDAIKQYSVKIIPANTVILSFKLTVGRLAITSKEMATNEAIAHFKTKNSDIVEYLYCYLKTFKYCSMVSTSSIATAFNSKIVKAMPFKIPDEELLKKFNKGAKIIFKMIKANQFEMNSLNNLKDTLLPKLMLENSDSSTAKLSFICVLNRKILIYNIIQL